ncbi:hypothetical protein CDAR_68681 [Caerostris darwini]|uniref:Uncharacterized protein n=1 Tax=Caerostris darwini TaxID=1538125 RepID=A0AAV4RAA4_9ARAC|nr:hypothetical protein CDAR_68681 [Caerostris darwini]
MEKTKWCLFICTASLSTIGYLEDGLFFGIERKSDCKGPPSIKIHGECELLTADGWVAGEHCNRTGDSNDDAVTCGESDVLFDYFEKESECLLTLTKKEIIRKKSQYLRDDVLSLLYECKFSTGLAYGEIENTNYGWIPPQTANAGLPDLKLAENTATKNPSAPSVLKRDIELMLNENELLNQIYCSTDLDSCLESECAAWLASSFTVHQK